MANLQHLVRLKEGVESWNAWRIEEPTPPDLTAAQLEDSDFGGFNFARSNFDSANLRGANLEGAAIAAARLIGADLTGAVLHRVNAMAAGLSRVSLKDSHATEANFCQCNVTGASFAQIFLRPTWTNPVEYSTPSANGAQSGRGPTTREPRDRGRVGLTRRCP